MIITGRRFPKSSRIAAVSDELRGEKIDIIRWSSDTVTFINNALAPAKVIAVELYEDEGVGLVTVPDYQLSLAISESEAEEARNRYLAQREQQLEVGEYEPVEGEVDLQEDAELHGVDPELIRKLEEFKRTMFDPSRRGGEG